MAVQVQSSCLRGCSSRAGGRGPVAWFALWPGETSRGSGRDWWHWVGRYACRGSFIACLYNVSCHATDGWREERPFSSSESLLWGGVAAENCLDAGVVVVRIRLLTCAFAKVPECTYQLEVLPHPAESQASAVIEKPKMQNMCLQKKTVIRQPSRGVFSYIHLKQKKYIALQVNLSSCLYYDIPPSEQVPSLRPPTWAGLRACPPALNLMLLCTATLARLTAYLPRYCT